MTAAAQPCAANRDSDDRSIQPHDRACRRRGHAHAVRDAQGAASGGGPVAAGACARRRAQRNWRRARRGDRAGHGGVAEEVKRLRPDAATFVQHERLGTAHAVLAAREAMARGADDLLVVFGDTPLISAATLRAPARATEKRRSARGARLPRRRPDRLWPAPGRGRPAGGDPRASRRAAPRNARSSSAMPV